MIDVEDIDEDATAEAEAEAGAGAGAEAGAEPLAPAAAVIETLLLDAAAARRVCDYGTAILAYSQVRELDPERIEALLAIAECHRLSGDPHHALRACVHLLETDPRHVGARLEMAEALRLLGRTDETRAIHDLLLHERPDSPYTWCGLARLLTHERHAEAAEACLRRALTLAPAHVPAQAALARHLARQGDHLGAIDVAHDTLSLAPGDPAHHTGLARSLMALGRLQEAAEHLDRALALDDEWVEARLARADLAVMNGRLEESWHDSEWRWHRPGTVHPTLPGRRWDGGPLEGGLLLVHAEDSASDTLRLIRFVPLLAERGARVALVVQPPLIPLLDGMAGVERVLADDQPLPGDLEVEAFVALPDLPLRLGFGLDAIPATAWLEAPPRRRRPILVPPDTAIRVGLAWAGNHSTTAIPFPLLLPLTEIPGVVTFSLEFSRASQAAAEFGDPSLVTDLSPTVADFADLAGRIAELDLIIAGDCATAHLAGAMNKPVLLLLPLDCHPRWMRGTDHSPWYPGMRLFRQTKAGNWRPAIAMVRAELTRRVAEAAARHDAERRTLHGTAAIQAALLAAHLAPGDLLVDVAAGDGDFTTAALAAHPADAIRVLAVEPHPATALSLRRRLDGEAAAEIVTAALGDGDQPMLAAKTARRGMRVFALPEGIPATGRTVRLETLLTQRPDLAARRLVLRLGQVGWESQILGGLGPHGPAVMIFEHRPATGILPLVAAAGFSLWRFPTDAAVGPVVPLDDDPVPDGSYVVLALAAGIAPAAHYGPLQLPTSTEDVAAARMQAEQASDDAQDLRDAGRPDDAAAAEARALMRDPFAARANADRGMMMYRAGRREAAVSCYRRALTRAAAAPVAADLATALRALKRHDEAEAAIGQALAAEPDNADFRFELALLRRDQGRLDEAMDLLRPLRTHHPDAAWTLAQLLVAAGELAAGFALFGHRPAPPPPALAPPAPEIPPWQGDDLLARNLLLYQDCDLADAVMLSRFIPMAGRRGGLITMLCQPDLAPLIPELAGVEQVVSSGEPPEALASLPPCDLRAALTDLPRLLGADAVARPQTRAYLSLPGLTRPRRFAKSEQLRVGLAWGGRPAGFGCPLTEMLALAGDPDLALMALVDEDLAVEIDITGAHGLVERITPPPLDLAETAAIIAGLDVVVGGDTVEIHLAAALGKPTWVLLPDAFTWRWQQHRDDSPFYPETRLFRQAADGSWRPAIARIAAALKVLAAKKRE